MDLKPSHFCDFPWESLLQKTEAEVIACNIMKIRRRLGDEWQLSWEDYERERKKDGGYSWMEKGYFEQVMPMIPDAIGAISFSKSWAEAAREASSGNASADARRPSASDQQGG